MMPFFARRRVLLLAQAVKVIVARVSDVFNRGSVATVTDFEGLIKEVKTHEMRFDGWRRVENLLSTSDLFTWVTGNSGEIVGDVCNFVNSNSYFRWDGTNFAPEKYLVSFTASTAVNQAIFFDIVDNADDSDSHGITLNITTVPRRYTFVGDMSSSTTFSGSLGFYVNRGHTLPAGTLLTMTDIQIEAGTGQANQNPSDFVGVGKASEPKGDEVWDDATIPAITNSAGSLGTYDVGLKLLGNANIGTDYFHPRFLFPLNIAVGKSYFVSGQLSGSLTDIMQIRLATNGLASDITFNNITGEIHGSAVANASGIQILTKGRSLWNVTIENLSITGITNNSNVDGVKYFDYENGNTVVGDIVTEAQGVAIDDDTLDGIPIEERRTNYFLYSEDFTTAYWAVYGGATKVSTGAIPSPLAGSIVEEINIPSATAGIYNSTTSIPSGNYTISFLVRAVSGTTSARIRSWDGAEILSPDIAIDENWQIISYSGNGALVNSAIWGNSAGDTTNLYIIAGQAEQGENATSLIKTTSSVLSRSPDNLSLSYTEIPQSFALNLTKYEPQTTGILSEDTYIFTTAGTDKIRVKIGTIDSITMLSGGVDIVIASTNFTANVRMNLIVDVVQQGANVNVKIKDGVTTLLNETTVGTLAHSDLNEIYIGSNGGTDGFTFATFGSLDDITLYDLT